MKLSFSKMSGAGNDFVCLDNRKGTLRLKKAQIQALCDRHFGVGADGLLLVEKPTVKSGADFRMRYYNADGGEADMCGNGARCFARYAQKISKFKRPQMTFQTGAGIVCATFHGAEVRIGLTPPSALKNDIKLLMGRQRLEVQSINTGVPHAVVFVDSLDEVPVRELGSQVRHHKAFAPAGTNVNFVQLAGPRRLAIRTYERGVEDETLACGTGVTAAALAAAAACDWKAPVHVQVRGGDILKVYFKQKAGGFTDVELLGPAAFVFEGEIDV